MKAKEMYIILKGIRIYAFHGVDEQERKIGANFITSLRIKTDFSKAAQTDSLDDTISYADIFNDVKMEMQTPSKLLENVCQRICTRLFASYSAIQEISISIYKENPPISSDSKSIGVEMSFERQIES